MEIETLERVIGDVRMVPIKEIRKAHFNPNGRCTEAKLRNLRMSIAKHGIMMPVVLTAQNELADGHRRLACAEQLGWHSVPAVTLSGNVAELFVSLNDLHEGVTPAQYNEAYVKSGRKLEPPRRVARFIEGLERIVGITGLRKLAAKKRSPRIYDWMRKVGRYCDDLSADFLSRVFYWLLELGQQYPVRRAMEDNVDPKVIVRAVNERKAITFKVELR